MKTSTQLAIAHGFVTAEMIAGACGISVPYAQALMKREKIKPTAKLSTGHVGRPVAAYKVSVVEQVKGLLR